MYTAKQCLDDMRGDRPIQDIVADIKPLFENGFPFEWVKAFADVSKEARRSQNNPSGPWNTHSILLAARTSNIVSPVVIRTQGAPGRLEVKTDSLNPLLIEMTDSLREALVNGHISNVIVEVIDGSDEKNAGQIVSEAKVHEDVDDIVDTLLGLDATRSKFSKRDSELNAALVREDWYQAAIKALHASGTR